MSIAEKFETIADAVYEKGELIGHEKGRNEGLEEGYASGVIEGKEAEYDTFWDVYQNSGKKTSYAYAFYTARWNDTNYNPKYNIIPSNANSMFLQSGVKDTLKPIDISALSANTSGMFRHSKLQTIRKLIVSEQNTFSEGFISCTLLKNISFEGKIGRDINFADCPLTVDSMKNIIEHLKNYAGTTSEFTYSVIFSSTCLTALEALDPATDPSPNGNSWIQYLDDIGWTNL